MTTLNLDTVIYINSDKYLANMLNDYANYKLNFDKTQNLTNLTNIELINLVYDTCKLYITHDDVIYNKIEIDNENENCALFHICNKEKHFINIYEMLISDIIKTINNLSGKTILYYMMDDGRDTKNLCEYSTRVEISKYFYKKK
jgi:hypothetical protein